MSENDKVKMNFKNRDCNILKNNKFRAFSGMAT